MNTTQQNSEGFTGRSSEGYIARRVARPSSVYISGYKGCATQSAIRLQPPPVASPCFRDTWATLFCLLQSPQPLAGRGCDYLTTSDLAATHYRQRLHPFCRSRGHFDLSHTCGRCSFLYGIPLRDPTVPRVAASFLKTGCGDITCPKIETNCLKGTYSSVARFEFAEGCGNLI